ncbi:DUF4150 domain-containing protein [Mesorhizobium cantuariense]|uniref:DUF4150 domain-containing protein n=1 Tax=Mesorhizobium cantuariense TaxID=1300275 RepID=A0ABV7MLT4_9HYPH
MSCTVFAEGNGFFHKGSGGTGTAPIDVCLSPPPPPTGPVPVPYVNNMSAGDLTKGSKSVKIDGNPTALENVSEVSTSSGNEAGTQGGGVVTHKTKGKASCTLWSFTVKVEGKGVGRHSDLAIQNCMSTPPNIICTYVKVIENLQRPEFATMLADAGKGCPPGKEDPPETKTTKKQRAHVRGRAACWSCQKSINTGFFKSSGRRYNRGKRWVADHQPPQSVVWKELGGCRNPAIFEKWKKDNKSVQPQCAACSNTQGGSVSTADTTALLTKLGI